MKLYRYLSKRSHANAWVTGGKIPIFPASTYRSTERKGIQTPDENFVHDSPIPLDILVPGLGSSNIRFENNSFIDTTVNGLRIPDIINASHYTEEVGVLCFARSKSTELAIKLGKRYCVEIIDIEKLRKLIGKQLGIHAVSGPCQYTNDHQRGHFLKSYQDAWQDEFRFVFKGLKAERSVILPAGIGKDVIDLLE